jgi:hypothetical protein
MKRLLILLLVAVTAVADSAPSKLTADETDRLVVAMINYYEAQIALMDALATAKAGNAEVQQASKTKAAIQGMMADLQKEHGAAPTCSWDFAAKNWNCPVVKQ